MSYNYGAKNYDRVKRAFFTQFKVCIIFTIASWAVMMLVPQVFAGMFTNNAELKQYTVWTLRVYMAGMFSLGFQICCQQSFMALGQAKVSLIMACLRKLILLIPLIFILPLFISNKVFALFLAEPVSDIMLQVMEKDFGNPSSRHTKGIEAEGYVTKAVQQIAGTLKCQPKEIILTSGGTESNNMALIGTALANQRAGKHVITTRIEHASIHEPFGRLEQMGYEAQYLPVDHNGHLQPEVLEEAVREDTLLVSVMMVNNEMGAVEDIKKLVTVAKQKNPNVIFHVDAIQAYGKYKIVPKRLGIDLMSVSGHKICQRRRKDQSDHSWRRPAERNALRYGECSGDCRPW